MSNGLKQKTLKGIGWSFADDAANQGIRFIVGLVLARLLTPHDFGIVGIALIFVSIFEDISDGGFSNALIQKKDPTPADYSTAFVVNLSFSTFLYAFLFFLAPHIAVFFNNPNLVLLMRVLSIIIVIDALMFVPKARLTKNLDFKIQTKISIIASIISGLAGITYALIGGGVWALVAQQTVRHLVNTSLLWFINRKYFSVYFSKQSFASMFSFGSKILLSEFINSIYRHLFQIVIGKLYTPATLGQFTKAHQFGDLFSRIFTRVIQKVSYPVLSNIQNENDRLLAAYRMLIMYAMFISFASMLMLAAVAKPLIIILIGKEWLPSVLFLQILCFSLMLYPLHAINLNILKVKGRSDIYLKLEVIKRIIGILPILLGIFFNIYYMLIGCVLEGIISYYLNSSYSGRLIGYSMIQQVKDIFPSFVVALIVSGTVYLFSFLPINNFLILISQTLTGFIMFIIISEFFHIEAYCGMKSLFLNYINIHTQN